MTATVEPQAKPAQSSEPSLQRQFVNFMFFKTDRAFRREPAEVKEEARRELAAIVNRYHGPMMVFPYTTVGLKPNTDFMLWRITYDLSLFQQMAADINKSILGRWLDVPVSYLSMTKHSQYVDEHVHEGQEGRRLRIVPGRRPYLFVYPFVKTREWYGLPPDERWRIMQEHIKVGREYPQVDNHTTYSFGLDDQEFVVAFDTDDAGAFLDLVQRLRATEASSFTKRDTPSFTCIATSLERALNALDGEPVPALEPLNP